MTKIAIRPSQLTNNSLAFQKHQEVVPSKNLIAEKIASTLTLLALLPPVVIEGAVVPTPLNLDVTQGTVRIDLNNDGDNDVELMVYGSYLALRDPGQRCELGVAGYKSALGFRTYASQLGMGETISDEDQTCFYTAYLTNSGLGPWNGRASSGYVALRFQIDGSYHWGFIELTVSPSARAAGVTIAGVAYNDVPGAPITTQSTSLAVEIVDFSADAENEGIFINWTTSSEIDHDRFEIQRSQDGIAFQTLGFLEGKGTGTMTEYRFEDSGVRRGQGYFYRLKSVGLDGSVQFTEIIDAMLHPHSQFDLVVYPNPSSHDELTFKIESPNAGAIEFRLFDAFGTAVHESVGDFLSGSNTIRPDLLALPAGIYYATLISDHHQVYHEIIISE